ncbi:energy transducer TonB [Tunturiibacter lichenicola]|uniref:energy transducer TonB n=1 Tax=Tunturiibacter lichenicola TaxID=2051959 RepID=UPI0021B480C6|nr:energy transducer TonB [Edaphobacter lichenicola]
MICTVTPSFALAQPVAQRTDNPTPTPQTAAVETDEVYKIKAGGDVSAPKLIHVIEPKLSKAAKKSNEVQTTWVKLKLHVETDGSVSNISIVGIFNKSGVINDPDSHPILKELEDNAVEAASLYKFEPGKKNGNAVVVELNITVSFAHT